MQEREITVFLACATRNLVLLLTERRKTGGGGRLYVVGLC